MKQQCYIITLLLSNLLHFHYNRLKTQEVLDVQCESELLKTFTKVKAHLCFAAVGQVALFRGLWWPQVTQLRLMTKLWCYSFQRDLNVLALWATNDASLLNTWKLCVDLNWWIQHFASSSWGKLHQGYTSHCYFHLKIHNKCCCEGRGSPWRTRRTTYDSDSLNKGKKIRFFLRNLTFSFLGRQTWCLTLVPFPSSSYEDGCRLQEVLYSILLLLLLRGRRWGRKETFA